MPWKNRHVLTMREVRSVRATPFEAAQYGKFLEQTNGSRCQTWYRYDRNLVVVCTLLNVTMCSPPSPGANNFDALMGMIDSNVGNTGIPF